MITLKIYGQTCSVEAGKWRANSTAMQDALNAEEQAWRDVHSGGGDDTPDDASARHMLEEFGGEILVENTKPRTPGKPGIIY
jgi:hypothetical protein